MFTYFVVSTLYMIKRVQVATNGCSKLAKTAKNRSQNQYFSQWLFKGILALASSGVTFHIHISSESELGIYEGINT